MRTKLYKGRELVTKVCGGSVMVIECGMECDGCHAGVWKTKDTGV